MTDIIVRVPNGEVSHFWEDAEVDDGYEVEEFWQLGAVPQRLSPGDFVWFQIGTELVARACVDRIHAQASQRCASTGRMWRGALIWWKDADFERLAAPVSGIPGFTRGFRYKEEAT